MSADLVTWLNGALDEDKAAAHAEEKWRAAHPPVPGVSYELPPLMAHGWDDPARVLAEVAAKRELLQLHSPAGITSDPPYKWACSVCHRRDGWWAGEYPCTTVRLLVAPFASRAGFDPSWLD